MLPDFAVADNPLDYTTIGVRNPGLIGELIDTVLADPNVGGLVLAIMGGPPIAQRDKADHLVPALARATKPAVLAVLGDNNVLEPFSSRRSPRAACRSSAHRTARCVPARAWRPTANRYSVRSAHKRLFPVAIRYGPVPANGIFPEYQGKQWLAAAGLPVPPGRLAKGIETR